MNPEDVTGVVLAGGRGSRMGGVDKGLQSYRGNPLALHAVFRLQPQVGAVLINANRNLGAYEALGVPVIPDSIGDFAGPLAGFMTGLEQSVTPWMVTVPCDSPNFPADLVARLHEAAEREDAEIAMAATVEEGVTQVQPVFCLLRSGLLESLTDFVQSGGRKIDAWTARHRTVVVPFPNANDFFNANTLEELHRLP